MNDKVLSLIKEAEAHYKELEKDRLKGHYEVSLWILPILLKSAKARKDEILASVSELKIAKENLPKLEGRSKLKPGLPKYDGKIDYTHDFFACQAFLTVSGQLQVESYACALTSVYTFGPLKAENSHTSSHLAEFWMVKPEIAFAELKLVDVLLVLALLSDASWAANGNLCCKQTNSGEI
nr:asparagine--tRNA ligase, cytoplasmic 3-like [Quercus suber]